MCFLEIETRRGLQSISWDEAEENHMVELSSAEQFTEGFQLQPARRLHDHFQQLPRLLLPGEFPLYTA